MKILKAREFFAICIAYNVSMRSLIRFTLVGPPFKTPTWSDFTSFGQFSLRSCAIFLLWTVRPLINDSDLTIINNRVYQNSYLDFITSVQISLRKYLQQKKLSRRRTPYLVNTRFLPLCAKVVLFKLFVTIILNSGTFMFRRRSNHIIF
jgi:hypothetical protein